MVVRSLRTTSEAAAPYAGRHRASRDAVKSVGSTQGEFAQQLAKMSERGGVRFSAHAANRIEQRGLPITAGEIGKVGEAIETAGTKGAQHSLVMGPGYALIVHVPNRTVVTAMEPQALRESVITNIDSAVFTR